MDFTKEKIRKLADLLMIGLTDEENELVLKEFDIIEKQMDVIADFPDIEKIEPMTHALDDFYAELREDVYEESIPIEELLANSDLNDGASVVLPKVV